MPTGIYKHKKGYKRPEYSKKMTGHLVSIETKEKISKAMRGENHWNWKGGMSFKSYSANWTEDLKRAIRKRDKYTCQLRGGEPAICVHHIDYDKQNCNPDNLITLCRKCHAKTNFNREYWELYFNNLTTWITAKQ